MKIISKQDRTRSRHATDTERKYRLGQIELTAEELDKLKSELVVDEYLSTTSSNAIANKTVANALNNKVNKESGKGLSTNDFTDEYIDKINNLPAGNHEHENKAVLDGITQEKVTEWNNKIAVEKGSNANGSWIKYSDGTMICTKILTVEATCNNVWGSMYESEQVDLGAMAQEFIEIPLITTGNIGRTAILEGFQQTTKANFGYTWFLRPVIDTHSATYTIHLFAFGKWK